MAMHLKVERNNRVVALAEQGFSRNKIARIIAAEGFGTISAQRVHMILKAAKERAEK